jgi:uncharacterized membrane protein
MNDKSGFSLIIATFGTEAAAAEAVRRLHARHRADRDSLPAVALVSKDKSGALTIKEVGDIGGKQGAAAGALAGGLVGLLSRRRGVIGSAALGALLGGVAAKKLDTGIPDPRLEAIGAALDAATGAAVAIVDDNDLAGITALVTELGAQTETEPFARETDFVKQLRAGDLAGAANTLANQAEGAIASATTTAVERAEALTGQTATDEALTLTDEEEIEMTIGPSAAATLTGTAGAMTPGVSVNPKDEMKPAPNPTPAQVAGQEAMPHQDAGGTARGDIDPAAAGVNDIWPPAA